MEKNLLRRLALGRFWGVTVAEQRRSTTHYHTFRQLIWPSEPLVNPKLLYTWKRPTLRRCAGLIAAADLFSLRLCKAGLPPSRKSSRGGAKKSITSVSSRNH